MGGLSTRFRNELLKVITYTEGQCGIPDLQTLEKVVSSKTLCTWPSQEEDIDLAPVVQTLDSAIHWINRYPADKY